jgi:hypothetical protein
VSLEVLGSRSTSSTWLGCVFWSDEAKNISAKWILRLSKEWGRTRHQRIITTFVEDELSRDLELLLMGGSIYEGEQLLADAERNFPYCRVKSPG